MSRGLSLRPDDAVGGGGLIDAGTVRFSEVRAVITGPGQEFDYGGKATKNAAALRVTMTQEGRDKPAVEYYNFGDPDRYPITDEGRRINAGTYIDKNGVEQAVRMNRNSGAFRLIEALVDAGFSAADIPTDGDVTFPEGIEVKVQRHAGVKGVQAEILLPIKGGLVSRPGERKTGTTTAKGRVVSKPNGAAGRPTSATAKVAVPPDAELDEATRQTVINVLAAAGGTVTRAQISGLAYKAADTAVKMRVGPRAYDEGFLAAGAAEGLWSFDGTTISLAG